MQFALALNEYDLVKHQPHPPGYILYVVLGRVVNAWLSDPTAAYVVLAVAFSGLTTFVVYYLALAIYDRSTALAAASLLAVSPLFWFYGSVGLTYAGEALFASTVAYFGFRALNGSRSDAYLAAWYLGIAGGMRQSLLFLLFPLWLGDMPALLKGFRNQPLLDSAALAACLSRVSLLMADHADRIAEIDINPIFVHEKGAGVTVADALFVVGNL